MRDLAGPHLADRAIETAPGVHLIVPTEARWNAPVPFILRMAATGVAAGAVLHYRSPSDSGFQTQPFAVFNRRDALLLYATIPCTMLQPAVWEYCVEVLDANDAVVGTFGTVEEPVRVDMTRGPVPLGPDGSAVFDCGPSK